jgi:hypothetical protein
MLIDAGAEVDGGTFYITYLTGTPLQLPLAHLGREFP